MKKLQLIMVITLIIAPAFSQLRENPFPQTTFAQNQLIVWSLATDENFKNARLVGFDIEQQEIISEITFPPDLEIGTAYWSPNRQYIAAQVGEKRNALEFYGEQICVFSGQGDQIWCKDYPSYVMVESPGRAIATPIAWSPDSSSLYSSGRTTEGNVFRQDELIHINTIDALDGSLQAQTTMWLGDIRVDEWIWSGNTDYALFYGWNKERFGDGGLFALPINSNLNEVNILDALVATEVGIGIATQAERLVYLHSGVSIEVAEFADNELNPLYSLSDLFFEETQLIPTVFGFSQDGQRVAFTANYGYNEEIMLPMCGMFVLDLPSNVIQFIATNDYQIDELTWSHDDQFIAARVCNRVHSINCEIKVYAFDGSVIRVNSGFAENSNPMWDIR